MESERLQNADIAAGETAGFLYGECVELPVRRVILPLFFEGLRIVPETGCIS